jgi:alkanesulfonate monooxygenase SsuD/methylene tetrahydromethanopterin reductase-like flavin-dependent oxidoreductase (luciferase family)
VEWGTGESNSALETGGFGVDPELKKDMWFEATEQAANMAALSPYPGYEGKFFTAPCRNVVPKPVQKPHPPMWMACSRRESIQKAAEMGIGALAFGFFEPEQAAPWVEEYYDIIKSDRCVPVGHTVNANIAIISGFSCHQDAAVAEARGLDGFHFFGYGIGHYYVFGEHRPGHTSVWEKYEAARENIKQDKGRGCIGTPDQLRDHLRRYEDAGMDQIIFIQQGGKNQHDHICESLELFAAEVMPEFKERAAEREAKKQAELAPYIKAALARKEWMSVPAEEDIPLIPALPKQKESQVAESKSIEGMYTDRTRDGSIFVPGEDPAHQRRQAGGDD